MSVSMPTTKHGHHSAPSGAPTLSLYRSGVRSTLHYHLLRCSVDLTHLSSLLLTSRNWNASK
eukprot:15454706-Heterocapsa_arctica.AAC.1